MTNFDLAAQQAADPWHTVSAQEASRRLASEIRRGLTEAEAAKVTLQQGVSLKPTPPPTPQLPPEVLAAREMKVAPRLNEVGAETLFGEDLISEKSLDEVILSYLAGEDQS